MKQQADDLLEFVIKYMDKDPAFVSKFIEENLRNAYLDGKLAGYKEGKGIPYEWSDK